MASRWAVDPRRSRASFMARQLGMTIKGTFMCIKGELAIDREALERSTAHVVIDATSLETALPGFGAILEAKDFLDVEHHPTIEFRSGAISRSGDHYLIAGELLFRGAWREVTVEGGPPEFVNDGSSADDAASDAEPNLARITGRATLHGLVADEELEVTIELEAVPAEAGVTGHVAAEEAPAGRSLENEPQAIAADAALGVSADQGETGPAAAEPKPNAEPEPEAGKGVMTAEFPEDEGRPVRILGLAGSYREGSHNQALLRAAIKEAPAGVVIEPFDLRELPFYDADLEAAGDPAPVQQLKEAIAAADAILIATPEYNRGLPARLKNAIDWASRPPFAAPLAGKAVALMGASTGRSGAARALEHAREALEHARARVLDQTVTVARAHALVDAEGELIDPETRRQVARLVRELADTAAPAAERAA
jgi:chromate reductase